MREIIFRGKDIKSGVCVQGSYYHLTEFCGDNCNYHYIIETCDGRKDKVMNYFAVIPETVGEYTGFDDKNGKKVFEGDILKAEIWWEQGGCYLHTENFYIEATFSNMYKNHFEKFEVVGNIYDNPELLRR